MKSSISLVSLLVVGISIGLFSSCKKDEPENPYDEIVRTVAVDNPSVNDIPVGNFAWLHGKIFAPTCANSGCHDGTFEPDFRTISSSYNSLVNHPVISNDATMSFNVRVLPGNAGSSLLNERLTADIPNSSGIMPLEVDEESDWDSFSASYISNIQAWINGGARDMYGNLPSAESGNLPPTVDGLVVFPSGNTTTPFNRNPDEPGITPIEVNAGVIDIWVKANDDELSPTELGTNLLFYASSVNDLDAASPIIFSTANSINAEDFSGNAGTFYHKVSLDLSASNSGDTFFLRTQFDDGVNPVVSTPNSGSNPFITAIFVIKVL